MQVNTYLLFNGNCEEAFKFYAKCLNGKIEAMMPHEGTPAAEGVSKDWLSKIVHARMNIDGQILMASDAPPERYSKPHGFSVNLGFKETKQAEQVYNALSEGGQVHMAMAETFWAHRFAMFTDRFGTPWMINCEKGN